MITKTHTLDKHAAIADDIANIANYQQKLNAAGFTIVEQTSLNPIADLWSVRIHDVDCPMLSVMGTGISENPALANALRTFIANISSHYFWADYYLGKEISEHNFVHYPDEKWFETNPNGSWPEDILNDELQDFYNPDGELNASNLIDTNSADRNRGICSLLFSQVGTSEKIYFPINIINNLYSYNGIATASTQDEARVTALSEVIENYVKFKVVAEGISLPNIPESQLNRYPRLQKNIKEIQNSGYSLLIQDASLGGKFPVVAISLLNPKDQGIITSFSAHPRFEKALENALSGLLKGNNSDFFDGFAKAGFDMDEIASPKNLKSHFASKDGVIAWSSLKDSADFELVDWDDQASSHNFAIQFKQLCDIIHSAGNEIYIADYQAFGSYTCRIIVPGMSEIYPVDDLVWENNNAGMDLRKLILKPNKTTDECEQLIESLEELDLDDDYSVAALIGLTSDQNNIFNDLSIAELITLLALKTQDNERIQEGCEWLIDYQQFNHHRLKTYQCINTLLQLDGMKQYATALEKLYTKPILNNALALIDGEGVFPLASDWKTHKALINSYKKALK